MQTDYDYMMFADYPDVVLVDDLTRMLGIGRNSAYKLVKDGEIGSFKVGRNYRIPKHYIVQYVLRGNTS